MRNKTISEINCYSGNSINPSDAPDTLFELYSVPSFDNGFPEIVKGSDIGSSKITVDEGDVLICKINPKINRVWVVKHNTPYPLLASSEWIVVRNPEIESNYLKWYFSSPLFRTLIISQVAGIGGSLTRAQPKQVATYPVPLPERNIQAHIASTLDKIEDLISLRKRQLAKLDELVKARFVEMFSGADSERNTVPMTSICDIIDGDRGKNYPKQDEFSDKGFCLFLNAKNVTGSGFSFEKCLFISKEKDELLHSGKLKRGDIVLTTRGTIGNLAYYTDKIQFKNVRINSGMVILRMKKGQMNEIFFIEQFKLKLDNIKDKIASGSAQPQLPISAMNKITMIVPQITMQNQFAAFAEQVNKPKSAIEHGLKKLETLKKALMQEYFG